MYVLLSYVFIVHRVQVIPQKRACTVRYKGVNMYVWNVTLYSMLWYQVRTCSANRSLDEVSASWELTQMSALPQGERGERRAAIATYCHVWDSYSYDCHLYIHMALYVLFIILPCSGKVLLIPLSAIYYKYLRVVTILVTTVLVNTYKIPINVLLLWII